MKYKNNEPKHIETINLLNVPETKFLNAKNSKINKIIVPNNPKSNEKLSINNESIIIYFKSSIFITSSKNS